MGMEPQNQSDRKSTQRAQCKSLYHDNKGRRSIELMVEQIVKSQIDKGIQVKICSTMFLYSEEGQITAIGTGL